MVDSNKRQEVIQLSLDFLRQQDGIEKKNVQAFTERFMPMESVSPSATNFAAEGIGIKSKHVTAFTERFMTMESVSPGATNFAAEGIFSLAKINGEAGVLVSVVRDKYKSITCIILLPGGHEVKCPIDAAKLQVLNWLPDCPRKYGS